MRLSAQAGHLRIGLLRGATVLLLFGVWEASSRVGMLNPQLVSPPSAVTAALWDLLRQPAIYRDIGTTIVAVTAAVAISVPLGIVIGVLLQESRYWGAVFKPFAFFPLSIPKSVFLPLFIFAFGIGTDLKIAFGVFSVVFLIILSTTTAIESVNPDHVTVARSYGATLVQIAQRVYLPSMLPVLLEGIRLTIIFAFTGVILAEMYASRAGLGYLIASWGENFAVEKLLAGIFLISAIAILINESVRHLEIRCSHWRD